MELSEHTVVVTGGAGFIGSHVVDRLIAEGAHVVAVDDFSVGTRDNLAAAARAGAQVIAADVCDPDAMEQALAGADVVVHMAVSNLRESLSNPLRVHDINATGTLVPCLAAVAAGVERFVYVSSSEAYGTARTLPMSEDHPLEPTTVYGASKAAGELYALGCMRTYGLPVTVVRPFNAYGPREHAAGTSAEVIPKFVTRILAGQPPVIFGDGSQTRDFTWVEETAAGIVAATASDELAGEAVNIAFGHEVSIREIADILFELLDADGLEPQFDAERPGDVTRHVANTTRAREVLGFQATVSIREGLERYVELVRSRGGEAVGASHAVRNW